MTRQKWKNIVIKRLRLHWNDRYLKKIQSNTKSVQKLCNQNELILENNPNVLFQQSIFMKLNDWIKLNAGLKYNQCNFHSQYWNLLLGSHHWFWSRKLQKTTNRIKKAKKVKKYKLCVICGQDWWDMDPLYHLLNECEELTLQIEGLPEKPMIKPEWIEKTQMSKNTCELIAELEEQVEKEYEVMETKWKPEFQKQTFKISAKINKYHGLYQFNWLQLNYIFWCLEKDFQTDINACFQ